MKFYVDRCVTRASGTQTFVIDAESEEEAKEKFMANQGNIDAEELDVNELGPWEWDTLYTE